MVKSNVSSQGYESGGWGSLGKGGGRQLGGTVLWVQGQQSCALCFRNASANAVDVPANQSGIVGHNKWSLIGACAPLPALSRRDFHRHRPQQVIMRII